jgi:hypothetical protein
LQQRQHVRSIRQELPHSCRPKPSPSITN